MELLQNQIKVKAPADWHFSGLLLAVRRLLQGIRCPSKRPSYRIRYHILWELEQSGGLPPTHLPLDQVEAVIGQATSRLDFNETSEELGLVKKKSLYPLISPSLIRQDLCSSKGSCTEGSCWGSWPEKRGAASSLRTLLTYERNGLAPVHILTREIVQSGLMVPKKYWSYWRASVWFLIELTHLYKSDIEEHKDTVLLF